MSDANEPAIRVEVVRGGDPGDAVLAAVAAILTRPVVVAAAEDEEPSASPSAWRRAARLEGVVHGRRIMSVAELVRHR